MPRDNERDYEVGYGKPPHHTRFKSGQSGNPRGRPPGAKNLSTLLTEALNEPVVIAEDGGRRKISKRQAIIKQLVNRSAKRDWRAVKLLLDILQDIEGRTEPHRGELVQPRRRKGRRAVDGAAARQGMTCDDRQSHTCRVPDLAAAGFQQLCRALLL
jgi:Family of unknown function (DUF5681)